jgi:hypothetical protein
VTEAERIWSEKSDEDLVDAAATLDEFTPDGQRIIRAELKPGTNAKTRYRQRSSVFGAT